MAGTKSLASRSPTPFEFHGSDASNSIPFTVEIPRFETEHMDADGDLVLEVPYMDENEQPLTKKFVVCSKTLSRSSPVFKKMLFGGFAESKQPEKGGEPWTVNLPDDDHDALKVLLDIVHSNFDKVPNSVTDLDDLYHIAVLTDKYDMTHLLRPWIRQWESPKYEEMPLWDDSREKSQDCFLEKHLWIAWQFGAQIRLYRLVRDLAQYSCLDGNGTLASKEDDGSVVLRLKDTLTPPGLYEPVADTRLKMIKSILSFVEKSVNGLIQGTATDLRCHGRNPRESEYCNVSLLGSIVRSLAKHQLWPVPSASEIKQSPIGLEKLLVGLVVFGAKNHRICSQYFDSKLRNQCHNSRRIEPEFNDTLTHHCEKQAAKCGFDP